MGHRRLIAILASLTAAGSGDAGAQTRAVNPYEDVNWARVSHYRADLHVHTVQSDGCALVEDVVRRYHETGFSILSITDHDSVAPNGCAEFTGKASPYPDPKPANFPADTTWPWKDYGAPSPAELNMLGIEGVELTCGSHRNVFFVDYGVTPDCVPTINEQFGDVARLGGLAVINHPEPRFKEWYREMFRDHSADYLVGMEISQNVEPSLVVWDQLLGELMPERPVWGFATSDMHLLTQTPFAFTVFLLDELTENAFKEAMRAGQFYAVVGPAELNLREAGPDAYEGTYPELRSITVDRDSGEISIDAANYDEIVWITGKPDWRYKLDPVTGITWPAGAVVQRGAVYRYSQSAPVLPYVRAEVIRHSENGPIRAFLNPFSLAP
jgi:hypothetical protein